MGQYMGDIKKKSRKKRIIGVAIAGVLIASLIIAGLIKKKDASKETDQITTERLQKRTIVTSVSGSGTIEATASENVTSTMTGSKVKSVEVKVGDVVIETFGSGSKYIGVVTQITGNQNSVCMTYSDGSVGVTLAKRLKKTGRRIDIDGFLKQIGGDE